jgi:hypothetical protein
MSVPDAATWKADFGGTPDLMDLIEQRVSLAGAVAMSHLLWPVFVVEQSCVLIKGRYTSENLTQWLHQTNADVPAVEAALSHVHLWDLFAEDPDDHAVSAGLRELAHVTASTWRCGLAETFPEREFIVEATDGDDDYGPTVSFRSVPAPTTP